MDNAISKENLRTTANEMQQNSKTQSEAVASKIKKTLAQAEKVMQKSIRMSRFSFSNNEKHLSDDDSIGTEIRHLNEMNDSFHEELVSAEDWWRLAELLRDFTPKSAKDATESNTLYTESEDDNGENAVTECFSPFENENFWDDLADSLFREEQLESPVYDTERCSHEYSDQMSTENRRIDLENRRIAHWLPIFSRKLSITLASDMLAARIYKQPGALIASWLDSNLPSHHIKGTWCLGTPILGGTESNGSIMLFSDQVRCLFMESEGVVVDTVKCVNGDKEID